MPKSVRRTGILIAACAALLVAAPAQGDAHEAPMDMEAMAAAFAEAFNAGNLDAVAKMYTDDGCRMPPNAEMVKGYEGVMGTLQAAKDQGAAKIAITVIDSASHGDMGHAMGSYELTAADGTHLDHGNWMNVAKRVDGEWKIHCDIYNSNMPMPGQAAGDEGEG